MRVFIFLVCALCGVLSGFVYDGFYIARTVVCGTDKRVYSVKDKIFTAVCDVLYFAVFAAMFLFCTYLFDFCALRLYMLVGCAVGALLYLKSLHIILAFFINKVYNSIGRKIRSNRKADGRRKTS